MKINQFFISSVTLALLSAGVIAAPQTKNQVNNTNNINFSNAKSSKSKSSLMDKLKKRIKVNGFLSTGLSMSNSNLEYPIVGHGKVTNKIGFGTNTIGGLQINGKLSNKFSVIGQVVSSGSDIDGNKPYIPTVTWAYLRFSPTKNWQIDAGRFRMNVFLHSDDLQVGYDNAQLFLPNEVYRIVPLSDMNGITTIYRIPLKHGFTLAIQPMYGESKSDYDLPIPQVGIVNYQKIYTSAVTTVSFNESNIYGGNMVLSNRYLTLRGEYIHTNISSTIPTGETPIISTPLSNEAAYFYGFGGKIKYHGFFTEAEYVHRETSAHLASLTGYYTTIGYRYKKIEPLFTYANLKTTNTQALNKMYPLPGMAKILNQAQQSFTGGLDFFINSHIVAKVAVTDVIPLDGTYGLFNPAIAPNTPAYPGYYPAFQSTNSKNNMIYSASLNFIF